MKIEDVKKLVKHKVILVGPYGSGKTHIALQVAFLFSRKGRSVTYIDPEYGCQKEIIELYGKGLISDEEVEGVNLIVTPSWVEFIDAIEKSEDDLTIVDCMSEGMRLFSEYLKEKYLSQGHYIVGGKEIKVKDPDTFTVPWELTSRVYDKLLEVMYYMVKHKKHILVTTHPIGGTTAREELQNSLMAKVDTVIELESIVSEGKKEYFGLVRKNRGGKEGIRVRNPGDAILKMFEKVI